VRVSTRSFASRLLSGSSKRKPTLRMIALRCDALLAGHR